MYFTILLPIILTTRLALALGLGRYYELCQCVNADGTKIDNDTTKAACDALDHSDYIDVNCVSTSFWGFSNACFAKKCAEKNSDFPNGSCASKRAFAKSIC
jgi:hypothetical protein